MNGGYLGISAFAITNKKFPYEWFLHQFPRAIKRPAIAILPGSFGWKWKGVEAFIAKFQDRPHLIEVHISNGPGRRAGKLVRGDFLHRLSVGEFDKRLSSGHKRTIRRIEKRACKIKRALERYATATTTIVVSPELETNLSQEAFTAFAVAIKRVWDVKIVANPQNSENSALADYYECHGENHPSHPKIIYNMDGLSLYCEDGERYFNQLSHSQVTTLGFAASRFATFLWSATQQGLGNSTGWGSAGAPPPKKRTFVVSSQALVRMHNALEDLDR